MRGREDEKMRRTYICFQMINEGYNFELLDEIMDGVEEVKL